MLRCFVLVLVIVLVIDRCEYEDVGGDRHAPVREPVPLAMTFK